MSFSKSLAALVASGCFCLAAQAQVGNNTAVLNPNTAEESALLEVPHVDSALASAIIAQRPFADMVALDALLARTLSETQRKEAYAKLFLPLNLNTAGGNEILLIPDMSNRMVHEFEEYRPYTSLTQFRREIGKYVDADEVARLEQYVFVPLDLNSATREDFLTIPGVGQRMVREFLEYRPYTGMEQFRREIGKYVDADEVARLERYMTIR
jgi:DNA uptake protein ComE-like DNA-binding protein